MSVATGCCPVCRRRYRLRADRTLQTHYAGTGIVRDICAGTGQPDRWAAHNAAVREMAERARGAQAAVDAIIAEAQGGGTR